MLANYINIMNRLTGMGDEMGTFINSYIKNFQESLYAGVTYHENVLIVPNQPKYLSSND